MKIRRIVNPIIEFARLEAFGGSLLITATLVALIWANSPLNASYFALWSTEVSIAVGEFSIDKSVSSWIKDGLMVIFFFVIGLEIKRELLVGALASRRKAMLPLLAAIGGMIMPALIYSAFNLGGPGEHGWGIPIATDIAFAMGILALLGRAVPPSLKAFLLAIAIVDDIGAVLIIAIFYSSDILAGNLLLAAGIFGLLFALNRFRVTNTVWYLLLGVVLWALFLESGIHPSIAGIILAFTIPATTRINTEQFVQFGRKIIDEFDQVGVRGQDALANAEQLKSIESLKGIVQQVEAPLHRLERTFHPWVVYIIMPLFALANAGVVVNANILQGIVDPISIGIILGLIIGKPLGIVAFSWLGARTGFASKLEGINYLQILGIGLFAGIGFTMSLFISSLAFGATPITETAKAGILLGSLIAAIFGTTALLISRAMTSKRYLKSK